MSRNQLQSASKLKPATYQTPEEQLQLGIRKLARLRMNLKALQSEISDKILGGVQDCRSLCSDTLEAVEDLNATLKVK